MFAIQENIRAALNAGNLALSLTILLSGFEINNIGAQVSALVWKVNCHLLIASAVFAGIGAVLILLALGKKAVKRVSAAGV